MGAGDSMNAKRFFRSWKSKTMLQWGVFAMSVLLVIFQITQSSSVSKSSPTTTSLSIPKDEPLPHTIKGAISNGKEKIDDIATRRTREKMIPTTSPSTNFDTTKQKSDQPTLPVKGNSETKRKVDKDLALNPPQISKASSPPSPSPQKSTNDEKEVLPTRPVDHTKLEDSQPTSQFVEGAKTDKKSTLTPPPSPQKSSNEKDQQISNNSSSSTSNSIISPTFDPPANNSTTIRQWGCIPRNETPFIFVHLGKAGGGGVRARIAAAALGYQRDEWFRYQDDPTYYYPVRTNDDNDNAGQTIVFKGKMANSRVENFLPLDNPNENVNGSFPFFKTFAFEGINSCHATTPLGHAIACGFGKDICVPHRKPESNQTTTSLNDNNQVVIVGRCDTVYLGHNVLGNEMHWLPTEYLVNWWNQSTWATTMYDVRRQRWIRLVGERLAHRFHRSNRIFDATKRLPKNKYCNNGDRGRFWYQKLYQKCMKPETQLADRLAREAVFGADNGHDGQHWSAIFASLPVLRVTMLREPFSWLTSRFFWQDHADKDPKKGIFAPVRGPHEDAKYERMLSSPQQREEFRKLPKVSCDDMPQLVGGWGKQYALEYLIYYCGEHCVAELQSLTMLYGHNATVLHEHQSKHLTVMEEQAVYNMRNSFAVVGLLHKTQAFLDMITARVDYMDTTRNPRVGGERHRSGFGEESDRCKAQFKQEEFQKSVMEQSPEIAAAVRLYEVGVEVYEFQKQELKQCKDNESA